MRSLASLFLLLWFVIGVVFSGLFWLTPFKTIEEGIRQSNLSAYFSPRPLVISPARYDGLRVGMVAATSFALTTLLLLAKKRGLRCIGWARLRAEWQRSRRRLLVVWWQLSPVQRLVAIMLGVSLVAVRGWLLTHCPITDDELTSYDCYVHPGLALTASNYSLPNNHVFYNLLVGILGKIAGLEPDLLQRLPTVVIGLGLLPVCYLLLLQYLRFSAATLTLGLFAFMPTPTFYAIAGRGYSLTLAATVAGFFATLVLGQARGPRRLATLVFVLSGIMGLYTVPTHAWVLASFGLTLLITYWQQPYRLAKLTWLALVTAGIAATVGLLYAPVGAISGWATLFQNPYVVSSLDWSTFWKGFYNPYLLDAASRLWGHGRWSTAVLGGLAVLTPFIVLKARSQLKPLIWLGYVVIFLPLPLMLIQHIYMPPRTLLASALGAYLLLASLAQEATAQLQLPYGPAWQAGKAAAVLLFLLGYGAYHLYPEARNAQVLTARMDALKRQYAWLQARQPQRVWLDEETRAAQGIYWRHIGLLQQAPLPLVVATTLPAYANGRTVEYAVFGRNSNESLPSPLATRSTNYSDEYICIRKLQADALSKK